jgi:hypothetical protein
LKLWALLLGCWEVPLEVRDKHIRRFKKDINGGHDCFAFYGGREWNKARDQALTNDTFQTVRISPKDVPSISHLVLWEQHTLRRHRLALLELARSIRQILAFLGQFRRPRPAVRIKLRHLANAYGTITSPITQAIAVEGGGVEG